MATFLCFKEIESLTTLLEQKNIAINQSFWFGVIALDNGTSTVWSRQLSDGTSASFLVHKHDLNCGQASFPDAREASPAHQFPFVCTSRTKGIDRCQMEYQDIIPIGFEKLVQLKNHSTSYRVVRYSETTANESLTTRVSN